MKKNFTVLVLMFASCLIFLPASGAAAAPGDGNLSIAGLDSSALILQQRRGRGRGRDDGYWDRRNRRRSGRWYGYRNYGQYRRTQVGNRRYRTVRRSVWRDGRRVTIWRRIFY